MLVYEGLWTLQVQRILEVSSNTGLSKLIRVDNADYCAIHMEIAEVSSEQPRAIFLSAFLSLSVDINGRSTETRMPSED